jgi:hypothetical protein
MYKIVASILVPTFLFCNYSDLNQQNLCNDYNARESQMQAQVQQQQFQQQQLMFQQQQQMQSPAVGLPFPQLLGR